MAIEAQGVVNRYEVSHRRSRRGMHQGSKTRIVLDIPRDIGDEMSDVHEKRVTVTIELEQGELGV